MRALVVLHTCIYTYHIPPGKLGHIIDSLSSLRHVTCGWKSSSSQPTIILVDVTTAVYLCFQKLLRIKINQEKWYACTHTI